MADAVLAKMKSNEKLGHFQRTMKTEAEMWEHPMFFSLKEGRIDPRTGLVLKTAGFCVLVYT